MLHGTQGRINNKTFDALVIPQPLLNAYSVLIDKTEIAKERKPIGWALRRGQKGYATDWDLSRRWGYGEWASPSGAARDFYGRGAGRFLNPLNCIAPLASFSPANTGFLRTYDDVRSCGPVLTLREDKPLETKKHILRLMGANLETQEFLEKRFDLELVLETTLSLGSESPFHQMSLSGIALAEIPAVKLYSDLNKYRFERLVHIGMLTTLHRAFGYNWQHNGQSLGVHHSPRREGGSCDGVEYVQFIYAGSYYVPNRCCEHRAAAWLDRFNCSIDDIPQI